MIGPATQRALPHQLRVLKHRQAAQLRHWYYVKAPPKGRNVIRRLVPPGILARLGLDDVSAFGTRRIEVGSGGRPQPGYIHVDIEPMAPHVEAIASAWELPFLNDWADEILAVHSLEHIHPRHLIPTLEEWKRVMKPGAVLRVHVPNIHELFKGYLGGSLDEKWAFMGAILGMGNAPDAASPQHLMRASDHQILFDADLLQWSLEAAGFESIIDLTEQMTDVHVDAWRDLVPRFSLIFEARKGLGA